MTDPLTAEEEAALRERHWTLPARGGSDDIARLLATLDAARTADPGGLREALDRLVDEVRGGTRTLSDAYRDDPDPERWAKAVDRIHLAVAAFANEYAAATPEATAPCRCVTKNGERQPTFGCPVHGYEAPEATAPQYETFTANDGEVSIRRTADPGGLREDAQWLLDNAQPMHFDGCRGEPDCICGVTARYDAIADRLAALTPEATAPEQVRSGHTFAAPTVTPHNWDAVTSNASEATAPESDSRKHSDATAPEEKP